MMTDLTGKLNSRYEFDRYPTEQLRLVWCEWLRPHGIDPYDVAIPGWIERLVDDRQIAYEAYDRDAEGHLKMNEARDGAVRVTRVFQLEAAPPPFPITLASFAPSG